MSQGYFFVYPLQSHYKSQKNKQERKIRRCDC